MTKCTNCDTLFTLLPGSHGKFCSVQCSSHYNSSIRKEKNIQKYLLNPKQCKHCSDVIPYDKRTTNKFCSKSCAAKFNNAVKDWSNITTGPVPKPKPAKQKKSNRFQLSNTDGPYTRIYLCTCKHTGIQWYSPTVRTIHPSAATSRSMYSYQCRFTFGIKQYPEWFATASELIQTYGWYAAANRGNNLNGCSRDHLFSVSDGFKNNIDPSIISHPANCRIIPHKENQSKNKKSIITLAELYERIEEFNSKYRI